MDTALQIDEERQQVMDLLKENKDKNFVRRIMKPDVYPAIDNGDGTHSTHLMAWSEDGEGDKKKFIVYPTITYDAKTKKLTKQDGDAAYNHAKATGEFIEFDTADKADWFSRNYKKAWDQ